MSIHDELAAAQKAEASATAYLRGVETDLAKQELANLERQTAEEATRNYRHGMITFTGAIGLESASEISHSLQRLARTGEHKSITLVIDSPGGEIVSGLHLVDDILAITKTLPVTIQVRGQAASMACVLLQAGTRRVIGPNSFLMLHRASFEAVGAAYEVEDSVEQTRMLEEQIYRILAKRTGKPAAWWKRKLAKRKDVWWTAEEALADGLVDAIE